MTNEFKVQALEAISWLGNEFKEWTAIRTSGNPEFERLMDFLSIKNPNDLSRGLWSKTFSLAVNDEIDPWQQWEVVGKWSDLGKVRVVWLDESFSDVGNVLVKEDDRVLLPSVRATHARMNLILNKVGNAVFNEMDLRPYPPVVEHAPVAFVDVPEHSEPGPFTLFWDGPADVSYHVWTELDGEPEETRWFEIGTAEFRYWDMELFLEEIGLVRTFMVSYTAGDGTMVESEPCSVEVIAKYYPIPFVPEEVGQPFSGWLFHTNGMFVLDYEAAILAIFENTNSGEASGAPITGHIYGREGRFTIGNPEYIIGDPSDEEE